MVAVCLKKGPFVNSVVVFGVALFLVALFLVALFCFCLNPQIKIIQHA
jgi:hypothetical protein